MKLKRSCLLFVSFILLGCNNGNVNKTKSPFDDSYTPVGMKGQYNISGAISTDDYNYLRTCIKDYEDNLTESNSIISSYTREEETRDLKAAYFGKNLGAANLCSLTHQKTVNTRYSNNVTTKLTSAHKENQTVSGGITKTNPNVNEYIFKVEDEDRFKITQQTWNDNESKVTKLVREGEIVDAPFQLTAYTSDIKNNFGDIERRGTHVTFKVLDDNNNAVYGKTSDNKYLIKEATSLYAPYSTTVGDTYKAVNNFFYEGLLEKVEGTNKFRFTNFRFYTELLILSEAISDEKTVPVLYLEKPQLVEYTEIKYTINYDQLTEYHGELPEPDPQP